MSLKLYSYWRSSCSWRVRICLALKGLKYDIVPIHLVKNGGEQHSDDYRKLNPSQQVPTLIDGDVHLTQSIAIMEYIEEKYSDVGASLLPKELSTRAKVRQVSEVIASGIQPIQNLSVLQKIGDEKMAWGKHWIGVGFDALEALLSKTAGKYCVGDDITMADACLVPQVYNANRFDIDLSQYPIINRINATLIQHEAFVVSAPQNQIDAPDNTK